MRLDGLWKHRDFVKLWTGQTVSVFGSMITGTALPFAAILVLDAKPFEVALLAAAGMLPALLFGLAAGVWVDRMRRRPLMIASDLGRAALIFSVPLAYAFDVLTIEHLYVVAFTTGVLRLLFDVAYQSYLPSLVTKEELLEGNSKLAASASVSEFAGFSAAGWLTQLLSAPAALLIDGMSFIVSAVSIGAIRAPEPAPPPPERRTNMRREAIEGLRAVSGQPVLASIAVATVLYSFGFGIFSATYLLFVTRGLGFDPGVLGVIFGIGGISSLIGAVMAGRAADRFGTGHAMTIGITTMGLSMLLIAITPEAGIVGAALLIAQQLFGDGFHTMYEVNSTTVRQVMTEERMLGRVNASMRMIEPTLLLVGTLAGGVLAELAGLRPTLTFAACCVVAAGVWLWWSPARRVRGTAVRHVVVTDALADAP